jgi:hypothetical protein
MSELVMTSWFVRLLLALVLACAAVYGSCRPVENQSWLVITPAVPALMLCRAFVRLPHDAAGQPVVARSMRTQGVRRES